MRQQLMEYPGCKIPSPLASSGLMDTIDKFYRLPRSEIVYFNAILDSYEGIAMIRTVDRMGGVIKVFISPDFVADLDGMIRTLDIPVEEIKYTEEVVEF